MMRAFKGIPAVSRVKGLSACACAALGWTERFAKVVGVPPAHWSKRYAAMVERRLLRSWQRQEQ
eukprot:8165625-Karenia_brevis.AAC.1